MSQHDQIKPRLSLLLDELSAQQSLANGYSEAELSFDDEMSQIREFIEHAGEYGLAYEYIVSAIESHPFQLSAKAAVSLLELGLLLGFKSNRERDAPFDLRRDPSRK